MLSYCHAFHAGNFADVCKHVVLMQVLAGLKQKEKPFCVVETHAGAGKYDVRSVLPQKHPESTDGIGRLWGKSGLHPGLADYIALVQCFNPATVLRSYPGSPHIIRAQLRPQDRLILHELHPAQHAFLKAEFAGDRQVQVRDGDGYAGLKAVVPPKERRGLIFIDPAFEHKGEWNQLFDTVAWLHQRWSTGIIAIWYPILDRAPSARFQHRLQEAGIPKMLCVELGLLPYDVPIGLRGSGMILINPPWHIDETLQPLFHELLSHLQVGDQGHTRVEWLSTEHPVLPERSA